MKKMMKLFHDSQMLGDIEFLGVDGSDMLGRISLSAEADKFKEMFEFLTDETKAHLEAPYPDSLLEDGWAIEDDEGIKRDIIGCPAILDNFTSIAWRWA
jgi:hypothetical protein